MTKNLKYPKQYNILLLKILLCILVPPLLISVLHLSFLVLQSFFILIGMNREFAVISTFLALAVSCCLIFLFVTNILSQRETKKHS